MKFLIDNNLSPRLAQAFRRFGLDATHVREYEMQRASDEDIFQRAFLEERIIVSADTDFGFLLAKWGKEKPSVILLRKLSPLAERQLQILRIVQGGIRGYKNPSTIAGVMTPFVTIDYFRLNFFASL